MLQYLWCVLTTEISTTGNTKATAKKRQWKMYGRYGLAKIVVTTTAYVNLSRAAISQPGKMLG
jgi:hypothetical protein